jgi:hypothetical protein
MPRTAADINTTAKLVDVIAALRIDLETQRTKAVATEALIDKLTGYMNGAGRSADEDLKHTKRRRRAGRPPLDPSDKLRAKKREAMRRYRSRQKAQKPAPRKLRRKDAVQEHGEPKADKPGSPPAHEVCAICAGVRTSLAGHPSRNERPRGVGNRPMELLVRMRSEWSECKSAERSK